MGSEMCIRDRFSHILSTSQGYPSAQQAPVCSTSSQTSSQRRQNSDVFKLLPHEFSHIHPTSSQRKQNPDAFRLLSHEFSHTLFTARGCPSFQQANVYFTWPQHLHSVNTSLMDLKCFPMSSGRVLSLHQDAHELNRLKCSSHAPIIFTA